MRAGSRRGEHRCRPAPCAPPPACAKPVPDHQHPSLPVNGLPGVGPLVDDALQQTWGFGFEVKARQRAAAGGFLRRRPHTGGQVQSRPRLRAALSHALQSRNTRPWHGANARQTPAAGGSWPARHAAARCAHSRHPPLPPILTCLPACHFCTPLHPSLPAQSRDPVDHDLKSLHQRQQGLRLPAVPAATQPFAQPSQATAPHSPHQNHPSTQTTATPSHSTTRQQTNHSPPQP